MHQIRFGFSQRSDSQPLGTVTHGPLRRRDRTIFLVTILCRSKVRCGLPTNGRSHEGHNEGAKMSYSAGMTYPRSWQRFRDDRDAETIRGPYVCKTRAVCCWARYVVFTSPRQCT